LGYQEGFEDALELYLTEVKKSKRKRDAVHGIKYLLGLIKEHKFDRIKQMLSVIK